MIKIGSRTFKQPKKYLPSFNTWIAALEEEFNIKSDKSAPNINLFLSKCLKSLEYQGNKSLDAQTGYYMS
jgi:hypothetical protein